VARTPNRNGRHILLGVLLCLMGAVAARAQVLAQRNWEGSGVTVEPWWRRAVFYRIDPATFQDSDGDGKGDFGGLTQRMDYLQSLGVDALILRSGAEPLSVEGFDDLTRAAVGSHLRVLVELGAPGSQADDARYVAEARQWLNQGAAGLYVPTPLLEKVDGAGHIAVLLHQLRLLTNSFPGGRVLLADAPAKPDEVDLVQALAKETQLTASPELAVADTGNVAAGLRAQLTAAEAGAAAAPAGDASGTGSTRTTGSRRGRRSGVAAESNPLLIAARVGMGTDVEGKTRLERALAVMLLVSRSAVVLEYGQELGLDRAAAGDALMQWTPGNVTRKPEAPVEAPKPVATGANYEGFDAYIQPLRKDFFAPPKMPEVTESDEVVAVVVDPDTLPGFTAGTVDATRVAANGATANVAMEQADPKSLLNLYRQLIQLHHENATVRNGAETVLDYDAAGAVVWVRHAPASSRISVNVVAVCNLSDKPVTLGNLGGLRVKGLRAVVGAVDGGTVAAGAVVVGEVR
jgi:hypothetical protein